jgi:hypothetical protein
LMIADGSRASLAGRGSLRMQHCSIAALQH